MLSHFLALLYLSDKTIIELQMSIRKCTSNSLCPTLNLGHHKSCPGFLFQQWDWVTLIRLINLNKIYQLGLLLVHNTSLERCQCNKYQQSLISHRQDHVGQCIHEVSKWDITTAMSTCCPLLSLETQQPSLVLCVPCPWYCVSVLMVCCSL